MTMHILPRDPTRLRTRMTRADEYAFLLDQRHRIDQRLTVLAEELGPIFSGAAPRRHLRVVPVASGTSSSKGGPTHG